MTSEEPPDHESLRESSEQSLPPELAPENSPLSENSLLPKIIPFEELARCGEEIWIENQGVLYRLRRTRQGKLILTK